MINQIRASGFKGLNFAEDLGMRTVFTGPVGSGKSARAQALTFLFSGTLPGHISTAKRGSDIMDAIASGDEVVVGAMIDGVLFERVLKRGPKGNVTASFRLQGDKVQKGAFELEIGKALRVANPAEFMALSDAKKVETLFRLFPPAGGAGRGVAAINTDCLQAKDDLSRHRATMAGIEDSIKALMTSQAEVETPEGTMAGVKEAIKRVEEEIARVNQEIGEERVRGEVAAKDVEVPPAPNEANGRKAPPAPSGANGVNTSPLFGGYVTPMDAASANAPGSTPPATDIPKTSYRDIWDMTPAAPVAAAGLGPEPEEPPCHSTGPTPEEMAERHAARTSVGANTEPESTEAPWTVDVKEAAPCACKGQYVAILKRILGTLEATGCEACAAVMLVKKFIREAK